MVEGNRPDQLRGGAGHSEARELDVRGRACPVPLLELAKLARTLAVGTTVLLLATDPAAEADLKAWCDATGNALLTVEAEGRVLRFLIRVEAGKNE